MSDPRVIKALAHPLRVEILNALEDDIASPTELADRLGASLGTVSYHVRVLADLGMLKLVKRTPRRGAVEHHYRLRERPVLSTGDWAQLPGSVKRRGMRTSVAKLGESLTSAHLAHPSCRVDVREILLDERGMSDLAAELEKLQDRVETIVGRAAKRGSADREVTVGALLLPVAPAERVKR